MEYEFKNSYYLILLSNFLFSIAFIPLIYEVCNIQLMRNIPYLTLLPLGLAFLLLLFVSLVKQYWIHTFIYFIGFLSICILLFLKKEYDSKTEKKKKH
jgi:hypothetical protein